MGKAFPVSGLGSEMSNYGAKRSDIQYLRAFAVACVVIFHARQSYLPNGYLGVDIFFFISGFVLTPQLMTIFLADKNQIKSKIGIFLVRDLSD